MTELLCPAGGMEQLKTALRYGADAVYGGAQRFGLRAFAGNFDLDELNKAIQLCHEKGKKFYLTLNILPFDEDMADMIDTAAQACDMGADAAIVSDLGAIALLKEQVPRLPVHVSTQANVMNTAAAKVMISLGAKRIVLAREMSLERIAKLRKQIPEEIELETFVHGAMCMSFSGRCMLSDHIIGRGGNKGACAQPCRWEYALVEKKRPGEYFPIAGDERGTYLLSAYDLCMLQHLPEMKAAGIASLKIEGRMKTANYVAAVTYVYRAALSALQESEDAYRALVPSLLEELKKASHRDWNTGFFFGAPAPASGANGFSQTMEFTGDVLAFEKGESENRITVRLKNRFYTGDILDALTPSGSVQVPVKGILNAEGEPVDTVSIAGQVITLLTPAVLSTGDILRGPNRNHQVKNA